MEHLTICKLLRDYGNANNLTQDEMAEKLSMGKRTYQRLERAERKSLTLDDLDKIAGVTENDIPHPLPSHVAIEAMYENSVANFCHSGQTVSNHASEAGNDELLIIIKEQRILIDDLKHVIEVIKLQIGKSGAD